MRVLMSVLTLLLCACEVVEEPVEEPTPCAEPVASADAFQAGVAKVRVPVPLGIGTSGNNGLLGGPESDSPYVVRYPATRRLHGHPSFKAIAMSRGEGSEIVFLRSDMIATIQQLRDAVVTEVLERTGRDLEHGLIMGATHTHSGPGRFIDNTIFSVIADNFWPAYYERLIDSAADAVEGALNDLGPAEFGYTIASGPDGHQDRRCEDLEDYTNDAMPLLVVKKEGDVVGVVVNYAIHGTVIGIDDLTLGQDVSGGIEEAVEDVFDHEVVALLINAWAGDVAPASPDLPGPAVPSVMPDGYESIDRTATYVAGVVNAALPGIVTSTDPEIRSRNVRYPISRQLLGYEIGEFNFQWGAVYCDSPWATCDTLNEIDGLDEGCIPFPEDSPAPLQSMFTVGQLGDLYFTTWSGESGTRLAEGVLSNMREEAGVEDVAFFGYANDYIGYALEEEDWWRGGYESSGGMWGPKQGEYMRNQQKEIFAQRDAAVCGELPFTVPPPIEQFSLSELVPWDVEAGIDVGVVATQPEASYAPGGVAVVAVQGNEPWLGTPRATLQREEGSEFVDVTRPGGFPLDSDTYAMWVDIDQDPSWDDTIEHTDRVFTWTFNLALDRRGTDLPAGTYRFSVSLPQDGSDPMVVASQGFEVTD
jgi:hypothetical protein